MIESLEQRIAPASLTMGGKLLTYTDLDGDLVKINFSHATMTEGDLNFIGGFLPGDTKTPQKLNAVNLTGKVGAGFTLTATPSAGKGDSHANIFEVNGTGTDLGNIVIDGNLGAITAGDVDPANGLGLKSLTICALMQDINAAVTSRITNLGSLTVKGDISAGSLLEVTGGAKSIAVGGSIVGNPFSSFGAISVLSGGVGTFKVGGSLLGNRGDFNGNIKIVGDVGTLSIGGSVIGSDANAPAIHSQVKIMGDVKCLTVGGDVFGQRQKFGGIIEVQGNAGAIKVGGSLIGSDRSATGVVWVWKNAQSIVIGHNVLGGDSMNGVAVAASGAVLVDGSLGKLAIGGDLVAGRVVDAGGTLDRSGMVGVRGTIGTMTIGGNARGDQSNLAYITAGGAGAADGTPAIKSLAVKGGVTNTSILAGYDRLFTAENPLAGIGRVSVGGDFAGSFITAGASKGGDNIAGNSDDLKLNSIATIGSVKIGGAFLGVSGSPTNYYIYAPHILKLQVGRSVYVDAQMHGAGIQFSTVGRAIALSPG